MVRIQSLSAAEARRYVGSLAEILLDCVEGGASVGFMLPFSRLAAEEFFHRICDGVEQGDRLLLAAFVDEQLVGTIQVVLSMPPNQLHRADLAKLLVLRSARQQGIGRGLMVHAEEAARAAGRTLLVLDTARGEPAETLYLSLGWTVAGVIPKFALFPDGSFCDASIFWKAIA